MIIWLTFVFILWIYDILIYYIFVMLTFFDDFCTMINVHDNYEIWYMICCFELWISILFEAVLQHMTRYNSAKDETFFRLAGGPAVLPMMNSTPKEAEFCFWAGNLKFWFFVFFFSIVYLYIYILYYVLLYYVLSPKIYN